MLSNAKGYSKRSSVLGFHRDTPSCQSIVCPHMRRSGRCRQHQQETAIRELLAREKEEELRKKAKAMYALQMDLLEDLAKSGGDGGEEGDVELREMRRLLLGSGAEAEATPNERREEVIEQLIRELKQEPGYVHWNLEAAVAERMVQQRVRPCRYSHRAEALQSLKRARRLSDAEDADLQQRQRQEDAEHALRGSAGPGHERAAESAPSPSAASSSSPSSPGDVMTSKGHQERQRAALAEERMGVFASFTPLQRCVTAMMWQRSLRLPQHVVCADVRRAVEEEAEAEMRAKAADMSEADVDEALEAFLDSPAFEDRVRAAENAVCERVIFRPSLGALELSFLPQIVSYLSKLATHHPVHGRSAKGKVTASELPLTDATLAFFGSSASQLFTQVQAGVRGTAKRVTLTEKELDLSAAQRAVELVEAMEWTIHVYNVERRLRSYHADSSAAEEEGAAYMKLGYRAGCVVLRSLSLSHCQLTMADGIIASLHKSGLGQHLLALDLSGNRLHSLRFLFALRAHFAERLLRLSLKNNLITRKPEYQEQLRKSLPRLTSLDGRPIRRPPLRFPKPQMGSYAALPPTPRSPSSIDNAQQQQQQHSPSPPLTESEYDAVMDTVTRFFYIWETRRIPHTALEINAFLRDARRTKGEAEAETEARLPEEEALNEDNFPHRYLHSSAAFTFTASPGLSFFDPDAVKLDREVELDDSFTGMRLSAHDVKDARVFDVSMRNGSRNLLAGRPALQRYGRGCDNCFLAYQYTLYPERWEVDHGLAGAVVSVERLPFGSGPVGDAKAKASAGRGQLLYVVSLHGVMTWRLPSMRRTQCFRAVYDRTMVLTGRRLAAQGYAWERRRSPTLVVCNDHVLLRPAPSPEGGAMGLWTGHWGGRAGAVFPSATAARAARLVVQFGLEACKDGEALVRAVMERTTSEAAEEAALGALVFGPDLEAGSPEAQVDEGEAATAAAVRAVFARQPLRDGSESTQSGTGVAAAGGGASSEGVVYHVLSLLGREAEDKARTTAPREEPRTPAPRTITLSLLKDLTQTLNERCALKAFS